MLMRYASSGLMLLVGAVAACIWAVIGASPAHADQEIEVGRFHVDPQWTYLATTDGYHDDVDEAVDDAPAIDLVSLGIQPGDRIKLVREGEFTTFTNFGLPWGEHDELVGVFASSLQLSPSCKLAPPPNGDGVPFSPACWGDDAYNRVVDAIDWLSPDSPWRFVTEDHGVARPIRTDIPEDFLIASNYLTVPAGATSLFVSAHDDGRASAGENSAFGSWYYDNGDFDDDFEVVVYRIEPDPPPPPDDFSIEIDGYFNSGRLTDGDFRAGYRAVRGRGELPGTDGGTATISLSLTRFLSLPYFIGRVAVVDPDAGVSRRVISLFVRVTGDGEGKYSSNGRYLDISSFPFRTGSLQWKLVDTG